MTSYFSLTAFGCSTTTLFSAMTGSPLVPTWRRTHSSAHREFNSLITGPAERGRGYVLLHCRRQILFHLGQQFFDGRDVAAAASVELHRAFAFDRQADVPHHLSIAQFNNENLLCV